VKALTIFQPYAELIVRGLKPVENRQHARFAEFRGPLLIHAGQSRKWLALDATGQRDELYDLPISQMAFGAVVGRVNVVAFFSPIRSRAGSRPTIPAFVLRDFPALRPNEHIEGPYCMAFDPVERLERPFPCRGRQGLFDLSIEDLEAEHGWPAVWLPAGPPAQQCRVCKCTEHSPCPEGCYWVAEDLCSACFSASLEAIEGIQ